MLPARLVQPDLPVPQGMLGQPDQLGPKVLLDLQGRALMEDRNS